MAQFTTEAAAVTTLNWMSSLVETLHQKGLLTELEVISIAKKTVNRPGSDEGKRQSAMVMNTIYPNMELL
jgi:hypothetical protein